MKLARIIKLEKYPNISRKVNHAVMAVTPCREDVSGVNRSSHAIIADIMREGLSGNLQTHIMYRTNLSYSQMKNYLNWVQSSGLMIRKDDDDLWVTTEKGREYLGLFDSLHKILCDEDETAIGLKEAIGA